MNARKPQAAAVFEKRGDYLGMKMPERLKLELAAEALAARTSLSSLVINILEQRADLQVKPGSNSFNQGFTKRLTRRLTRAQRLLLSCLSQLKGAA